MQVCLNEVRRLQGLPPLAVASTTTTTTVAATGGAASSAAAGGNGPAAVTATAAAAVPAAAAAPPAMVPYTVYLHTGDSKPSSFDGSLYLQLQASHDHVRFA